MGENSVIRVFLPYYWFFDHSIKDDLGPHSICAPTLDNPHGGGQKLELIVHLDSPHPSSPCLIN